MVEWIQQPFRHGNTLQRTSVSVERMGGLEDVYVADNCLCVEDTPKCSEKNCRFSIMSEWMNEYNNRHSTIRPSNVRQCSLNECMSERMDEWIQQPFRHGN